MDGWLVDGWLVNGWFVNGQWSMVNSQWGLKIEMSLMVGPRSIELMEL